MWFDELDSTNTYLKEKISSGALADPAGTAAAAKRQLKGRGRKARIWNSAEGENLTFSFVSKIREERKDISSITLTAGVAVCEVLRELGIEQAEIKWPNDILCEGRKICGILCETADCQGQTMAVCGIGLNINMTQQQLAKIDQPASSVYLETGICYRPEDLINTILEKMSFWFEIWLNEGFAAVKKRWEELAFGLGLKIDISEDGEILKTGLFRGITDHGALVLERKDNRIEHIYTGDVNWKL
ncbi:Bifunctional protein BirA [Sedimentisphaera cyanobacteriorum]|uniref:biotin--[biotin carboxyl-carrier protein] ligase n=1 Tax=Sedimentisphaera cyanobacteriorum TaxID=1940790 RepID=A0A1Q2HPL4_9BACT|nr:biotin--[acetyl-CoA-carboxylase] ligase [Sedimentisphaera cyanobacteriorum]AQQ09271.1 Bifunctional protein BirA [Sedimentisphaera cyanobacteriorum]